MISRPEKMRIMAGIWLLRLCLKCAYPKCLSWIPPFSSLLIYIPWEVVVMAGNLMLPPLLETGTKCPVTTTAPVRGHLEHLENQTGNRSSLLSASPSPCLPSQIKQNSWRVLEVPTAFLVFDYLTVVGGTTSITSFCSLM